jgi:hypothetical protein
MSLVNPIVGSLVGSLVGDLAKTCRQVAIFNGVSQYVSIPPVTLLGDFEIEMFVNLKDRGGYLLAEKAGTSDAERFGFTADQRFFGLGLATFGSAFPVDNGEVRKVIATRVAGNLVVSVDDIGYASENSPSTLTFDSVFSPFSGSTSVPYLEGVALGLKIWSGGDRNTGTLIRNYPIDDGWTNNPTVRDLVSNQDGEMINGTEAMWSERCDL